MNPSRANDSGSGSSHRDLRLGDHDPLPYLIKRLRRQEGAMPGDHPESGVENGDSDAAKQHVVEEVDIDPSPCE